MLSCSNLGATGGLCHVLCEAAAQQLSLHSRFLVRDISDSIRTRIMNRKGVVAEE